MDLSALPDDRRKASRQAVGESDTSAGRLGPAGAEEFSRPSWRTSCSRILGSRGFSCRSTDRGGVHASSRTSPLRASASRLLRPGKAARSWSAASARPHHGCAPTAGRVAGRVDTPRRTRTSPWLARTAPHPDNHGSNNTDRAGPGGAPVPSPQTGPLLPLSHSQPRSRHRGRRAVGAFTGPLGSSAHHPTVR